MLLATGLLPGRPTLSLATRGLRSELEGRNHLMADLISGLLSFVGHALEGIVAVLMNRPRVRDPDPSPMETGPSSERGIAPSEPTASQGAPTHRSPS